MVLVMDTALARTLAQAYTDRSDVSLEIDATVRRGLDAAAIEDFLGLAPRLVSLSDDLAIGGVLIRQQANLMEGLDVPIAVLAEQFGVEEWKVERQLRMLEKGKLDLGDVFLPLAGDWAAHEVTGLDSTVRDFIPDAPEFGADPEFDALVQRLDSWLLSHIVGTNAITQERALANPALQADLVALYDRLGGEALSTLTITREWTEMHYAGGQGDNYEEREHSETRHLDRSEQLVHAFDFVTELLGDERKLGRAGVLPEIGDFFDFTTYIARVSKRLNADDDIMVDETRWRSAEDMAALRAQANKEWADLAWLPAYLVGRGEASALDTPEAVAKLLAFATEFGLEDTAPQTADAALAFLKSQNLVANALQPPAPIHEARLPFDEASLDAAIAMGQHTGVITEGLAIESKAMAAYLVGLDPQLDLDSLTPEQLSAEAPELNIEEFLGMLSTRIPRDQLNSNRIFKSIAYVSEGTTVEERMRRLDRSIQALNTVAIAGEPAMTGFQWTSAISSSITNYSNKRWAKNRMVFHGDHTAPHFRWLLDHTGLPGYHKSPDWQSGKGKEYWHLSNNEFGNTTSFQAEYIPKKKSPWGQIIMTVVKVVVSIYCPPAGVMFAAMDAAVAAAQGDWRGAAISAVGALAAGAGAWASSANSAAAAASAAAKAGTGAVSAANAANATAKFASAVAKGAMFVDKGVRAGIAFSEGDVLGGVVNSVSGLAAGTSAFGYTGAADTVMAGARVVESGAALHRGIKNDDLGAALAAGVGLGASVTDFAATGGAATGQMSKETSADLRGAAVSLRDAERTVRAGDALVKGIENDDIGGAVAGALQLGASGINLFTNNDGVVGDTVFTRNEEGTFVGTENWAYAGDVSDGLADLALAGNAIADKDYLAGARLLSAGADRLADTTGFSSTQLDRLRRLSSVADKAIKAPPGATTDELVGLLQSDLTAFVDSFNAEVQPTTTFQDPAGAQVRVEAQLAADRDALTRIKELSALDPDNAMLSTWLDREADSYRSSIDSLTTQQAAIKKELARQAAEAPIPVFKPLVPTHLPQLRPPVPSHIPQLRPGAALPPGAVVVMTPQGPRIVAGDQAFGPDPALTQSGQPLPGLGDMPPSIQLYEGMGPYHPMQWLPEFAGDLAYGRSDVLSEFPTPFGKVTGPLVINTGLGRITVPGGRNALNAELMWGLRGGLDANLGPVNLGGAVTLMPGAEDLHFLPDLPGGLRYRATAPPGELATSMPSLFAPHLWDPEQSVSIGFPEGGELLEKGGLGLNRRFTFFNEDTALDMTGLNVTHRGNGLVAVTHTDTDTLANRLGPAVSFNTSAGGLRFASHLGNTETATSGETYLYQLPGEYPEYLTHLEHFDPLGDRQPELMSSYGTLDTFGLEAMLGAERPRISSNNRIDNPFVWANAHGSSITDPSGSTAFSFTSDGWFHQPFAGTIDQSAAGGIENLTIEGSVRPAIYGVPIPFTDPVPYSLDTTAVTRYLDAAERGADPIDALFGDDGVPIELLSDPVLRSAFDESLGEVLTNGNKIVPPLGVVNDVSGQPRLIAGPFAPPSLTAPVDDGEFHAHEFAEGALSLGLDLGGAVSVGAAETGLAFFDAGAAGGTWLRENVVGLPGTQLGHDAQAPPG